MNIDSTQRNTKDDPFAEMRRIEKKLEKKFKVYATVKAFKFAMQHVDERLCSIESKFYTREDHALDMIWMDEALTEIKDAREERKLRAHRFLQMDDRVVDHEKRIRVLEKDKVL